jgi:integron integrase
MYMILYKKYSALYGRNPMDHKLKLLDLVRQKIRLKHHSIRTERVYVDWIKRFILFRHKRHQASMAAPEVHAFLSHLAIGQKVAASTQRQALSAIVFLYREILDREVGWLGEVERAKQPERLPVVFSRAEVRAVLVHVDGQHWLMASLLYGAGLRLMECVGRRVKDVDYEYRQILVRDGKGPKDCVTMLPQPLAEPLKRHLEKVNVLHQQDLTEGFGEVYLPSALERKYASASHEWGWQCVFPARRRSIDPRSGTERRHHIDEKTLQDGVI